MRGGYFLYEYKEHCEIPFQLNNQVKEYTSQKRNGDFIFTNPREGQISNCLMLFCIFGMHNW